MMKLTVVKIKLITAFFFLFNRYVLINYELNSVNQYVNECTLTTKYIIRIIEIRVNCRQ